MKKLSASRKKLIQKLTIYTIGFLIVVVLAAHFYQQAHNKHEEYENFKTATSIEENMRIGFVIDKFKISDEEILIELKLPENHWNKRFTVAQACKKSKLDCNRVIDNLNKLAND
jgi:hypothetical protein